MSRLKRRPSFLLTIPLLLIGLLAGLVPSLGQKAQKKPPAQDLQRVKGTLKSVKKNQVVIETENAELRKGKKAKTVKATFTAGPKTRIKVGGTPATLSDLSPGMFIVVEISNDRPFVAVEIRAADLEKAKKSAEERSSKTEPRKESQPENRTPRLRNAGFGVVVGPSPTGALVLKVMKNTPAAKAGLRRGDYILEINEKEIVSADQLVALIGRGKPGRRIELRLWRDGKADDGHARLTNYKRAPDQAMSNLNTAFFGLCEGKADSATKAVTRNDYGLSFRATKKGIVVNRVRATGIAARAGILKGDRIVSINGQAEETLAGVRSALQPNAAAAVNIVVERDGQRKTLKLPTMERRRPRVRDGEGKSRRLDD